MSRKQRDGTDPWADDAPAPAVARSRARRKPDSGDPWAVDAPAAPRMVAPGVVDIDWPPAGEHTTGKKRARTRGKGHLRTSLEWVAVIVGALAVALIVRTVFVQTFYIPSGSMESTLNIGDRVLVNKLAYKAHEVHRGDVIVFRRPPGLQSDRINDLIKRVIGLPGETVEGHDGHMYVNGYQLDEPYVKTGEVTNDFGPAKVPDGMVWVMGDNRGNSADSRVFGPIPVNLIEGRAFVLVWPLNRLGWL